MRRVLACAALAAVMLYCSTKPAPQPAPEPPPASAPSAPVEERVTGSVRVTASTLNVRADSSADSAVVTRVRRGTRLDVLAERSGWVKVRLASGEVGWVAAQHVSRGNEGKTARRRGSCPPDSDFSFVKTPVPAFSDRGAHGLVVVDASVNTAGEVTSTKIVTNQTGDEALGVLAEREIRSARFSPPIRNCVPRSFIFTYKRSF